VSSSAERKFKREKVDIRVRLRRWEEKDAAARVMRTFELSEGGLSVYAPDPLEVGTCVMVSFSLPPEESPIRVRAMVRNRHGFRCGLEFVDLPAAERFEIVRYLGAIGDSAAGTAGS
jgi:c-di-GMP-binding flagellar brake protein YcgR